MCSEPMVFLLIFILGAIGSNPYFKRLESFGRLWLYTALQFIDESRNKDHSRRHDYYILTCSRINKYFLRWQRWNVPWPARPLLGQTTSNKSRALTVSKSLTNRISPTICSFILSCVTDRQTSRAIAVSKVPVDQNELDGMWKKHSTCLQHFLTCSLSGCRMMTQHFASIESSLLLLLLLLLSVYHPGCFLLLFALYYYHVPNDYSLIL